MRASEILEKIHQEWIARAAKELSDSEAGREFLVEELERYFELLQQAFDHDDPGWLNPVLIDWAASRTETELSSEEITMAPILKELPDSLMRTA